MWNEYPNAWGAAGEMGVGQAAPGGAASYNPPTSGRQTY